jgi:RNA polymerase sigma-70 factor (ECF subfamily)
MDSADKTTKLLEQLRPTAFAIAYRMLGSVSDAEDMVQEALLRLHNALRQDDAIASPQAYLATVVTRLCIDELRSARNQREVYVGEWLPEPLVNSTDQIGERFELSESLSMAFLVLLESLSPEQRAALLLRDVFDYDYAMIARIIGKSEAACRQLVVRARSRVLEGRPRFDVAPGQRELLAERFFAAIDAGDLAGLEALLAEDVSLHGDGGGKVPALARPLFGRSAVARALLSWARVGRQAGGYTIRRAIVNAQSGALIATHDGAVVAAWVLDTTDEHITAIRSVVNPDKLRHIPGSGDFGAFITRAQRRSGGVDL